MREVINGAARSSCGDRIQIGARAEIGARQQRGETPHSDAAGELRSGETEGGVAGGARDGARTACGGARDGARTACGGDRQLMEQRGDVEVIAACADGGRHI
ncbi:hypothetical protein Ctob_003267 [Chrysochromulina tobinii]|uniref:Uncharacterized protein n=1 Tax=Chrysochromulina tobinii TaxID=1460289 RepID=A0A0M0JBW5_9EUKA|nr:hypothetical protein Ctob_003267 [Chrysochromulina tobinii]|eukprot:KOO24071.1 hypothetical protein Ctob_003267 [Chrysochromulina sp. CCMP291]